MDMVLVVSMLLSKASKIPLIIGMLEMVLGAIVFQW